MMKTIFRDLLAAEAKSASVKNLVVYFITHPEFKTVLCYRLYTKWYKGGAIGKAFSKFLWLRVVKNSGCYISPKSIVGAGLRLPHATGVVIGDGVTIGENACIYQHVTIGQKGEGEYPVVEDGVTIFAGACVIGGVKIGENSVVGANSVVNKDVPAGSVVAGVPAKTIKQ